MGWHIAGYDYVHRATTVTKLDNNKWVHFTDAHEDGGIVDDANIRPSLGGHLLTKTQSHTSRIIYTDTTDKGKDTVIMEELNSTVSSANCRWCQSVKKQVI
jgi:hypothetical protein